jgi:pimeloyl-ACP methyl ester carboxylesterase
LTLAFHSDGHEERDRSRRTQADIFAGGWDGRSRMSSIDTKKCPVYMLTGEYDWSNTPEMGQATCEKITGGKHQAMKGVGHFPATENPKVFVGYCEYLFPEKY